MLVFTPLACGDKSPLGVIDAVADYVDVVQVRPKPLARKGAKEPAGAAPCSARETYDWTLRILDVLDGHDPEPLVLVDDRVDVARALWERGCAGVHLGQTDCPPQLAREFLGAGPLIGVSTHDMRQVAYAIEEPIDYIGFGPVFPTTTKGYAEGLGAELAWVAAGAIKLPLFPIGGIDATNVEELEQVGRIAVGSAILASEDPAETARELEDLLLGL